MRENMQDLLKSATEKKNLSFSLNYGQKMGVMLEKTE